MGGREGVRAIRRTCHLKARSVDTTSEEKALRSAVMSEAWRMRKSGEDPIDSK